jgi:hypothetical protein
LAGSRHETPAHITTTSISDREYRAILGFIMSSPAKPAPA